jgi:hypothetical protein
LRKRACEDDAGSEFMMRSTWSVGGP